MEVRFIEHGSAAYTAAAKLRYRVFYQPNGCDEVITQTQDDAQDCHVAILQTDGPESDAVVAYGRLAQSQETPEHFSLQQMVVEPAWQGKGLGTLLIQILMERAKQLGATYVSLNARVPQTGFYERQGFQAVGEVFPSVATGVDHIKMEVQIEHES